MFTCLNDIKIDPDYYTRLYIKNFEGLINQKEKDRNGKIDQIMAKLKDEKILKIEGNDSFKERIYTDIRKLLTVKPGRVLIKELIRLVELYPDVENSIHIKSGEMDFHHSVGTIELSPKEYSAYNALSGSNEVVCLKPKEIILAHELIHNLHKREDALQKAAKWYAENPWVQKEYPLPPDDIKDIKVDPDPQFEGATFEGFERGILLKGLDTLAEQRAILGLNLPRLLKREKVEPLDVLCENAFLCAFHFFPRIDHQNADNHCIKDVQENKNGLSLYYNWILLQLNKRNEQVEKIYSNLIHHS